MLSHTHLTDDIAETTSLYALGVMSETERAKMEEHLAQGCALCESEISRYGDLLARWIETNAVTAPTSLRDKLLESIREKSAAPSRPVSPILFEDAGLLVLRTSQMEWTSPSPGFSVKILFDDQENDMITRIVRLEPGTTYPPHRHKKVEEVYVLQGHLQVEGVDLREGDFCLSRPDTVHQGSFSKTGCLLVVKTSKHDETYRD
jgi:quercetin dioxygenase-like cupin family protein